MKDTQSNSFVIDLKKWEWIADNYNNGAGLYHCTLPTDGICAFRDTIEETKKYGLSKVEADSRELGTKVRKLVESYGFKSVAAPGH